MAKGKNKFIYTLPTNKEKYELLRKKNKEAEMGGGLERIDIQHKKGNELTGCAFFQTLFFHIMYYRIQR